MAEVENEPVENGEAVKIKEEKPDVTEVQKKIAEDKNEPVENGDSVKVKEEKSRVSETAGTISDLERKIIDQIEYYFGDCNLPRDRFLQEQIKLDDGWVPLEVMVKFNRLAKLSTDLDFIISALKKSDKGLVEVNEDNKKIRRDPSHTLPEMNEARRQVLIQRSLYVKGFPSDVELDKLLEYFAKYVKIEQLIMRRYHDRAEKKWVFKGSVFAVFPSIEEAEKFLKLENLKYGDTELIKKWQNDYIKDKKNERLHSKLEIQNKKRKLKDAVEDEGGDEGDSLPKGAGLYISDCPPELSREEVKSKIEEFGIGVAYLYFNKGDSEGWIRLQEADSAAEVVKNLKDGKLEIKDYSISVRPLEGEEEIKFLERVKDDMAKRRSMNKFKGKKGRGGGGHGNSFKRKRKGSPVHEHAGSPKKKAAVEAKSD